MKQRHFSNPGDMVTKPSLAHCSNCGDLFQPNTTRLLPVCNWCNYEDQPIDMLYSSIIGVLFFMMIILAVWLILILTGF